MGTWFSKAKSVPDTSVPHTSVLPTYYPFGTAYEHLSWLSLLLAYDWHTLTVTISAEWEAPVLVLTENTSGDDVVKTYTEFQAKTGEPVNMFIALVLIPGEAFEDAGSDHAAGMFTKFDQYGNDFFYFDPNGPTLWDQHPQIRALVLRMVERIMPAITSLQEAGVLVRPQPQRAHHVIDIRIRVGVQKQQAKAFRTHNIKHPGMCAIISLMLLWHITRTNSRLEHIGPLEHITQRINLNFLHYLIDFTKFVWFDCLRPDAPEFRRHLDELLQAVDVEAARKALPSNKMAKLADELGGPLASASWRPNNDNTHSNAQSPWAAH